METYCLRVTAPEEYQGWWVVDPIHFTGTTVPAGFGCVVAPHPEAAALSSWDEPKLSEIRADVEAAGFSVVDIPLESAKQYMLG